MRAGGVGGSGGVTLSRVSGGGRHTRSSTRAFAVRRTSRASCNITRLGYYLGTEGLIFTGYILSITVNYLD